MTYLQKVLQPGEVVQYETRLHWIVYLPGFLLLVCAVVAFGFAFTNAAYGPGFLAISCLCVVVALASLISRWIVRWTTEIAITDRRVIYKTGFVRRRSIEMNMDKVESVDVYQSIFGRLFDFGTITVRGTGSGIEPLDNIDAPLRFRSFVTAR